MKKIILVALVSIGLLTLAATYEILWAPNEFEGEDRFVIVSKGETFRDVVDSLQQAGVIRNRLLFEVAGRLLDLTTRMQVGKYRFTSGMSNKEILEDLRYGRTIEPIFVTIPEGMRATRQARVFTRLLGIDSVRFMTLATDTQFLASLGISAASAEGYLMPDTYRLYWQMEEEDLIRQLVNEFWRSFDDTMKSALHSSGRTLNEILTLASIVEGETSIDSERAIIAGVYYNRLEKKMPLQADPTIQYILSDGPRRLRYSDLQRESEYNTYRRPGLPPGPINNPGKASILAALFPKRHGYFFFVANGQGGHTFSKTYSQHVKAAMRFRKWREEQEALKEAG